MTSTEYFEQEETIDTIDNMLPRTEQTESSSYDPWESSSGWSDSSSSDPAPFKPGISVRYSWTTPEQHPALYAYAFTAEVVETLGYPDHIFVFQRSKPDAYGNCTDTFVQIASPLDIEEVPENAPDLLNNMPYYRAKSVTVWFRTKEDLEIARRRMRDDINVLVQTYDSLNGQPNVQEIERYERY